MKFLIALFAAGLTLMLLDAIWLSTMASTYRRLFGDMLLDNFRLPPAVAFYVLYTVGLVVLVVLPAVDGHQGLGFVGFRGAILGLVAYGTYSLTNHATLKGYGSQLAAMDIAWGPVLTAAASLVAVVATRFFTEPA